MYLTLEQVKKHLLVDDSFKADDSYITDLITVAEDSVSKHLDIALDELDEGGTLPSETAYSYFASNPEGENLNINTANYNYERFIMP